MTIPVYITKFGSCRAADPGLFFPLGDDSRGDDALEDEVVGYLREFYCDACPVRKACHDYALANEKHGVWAGTTSRDRRRLRAAAKRGAEMERDARETAAQVMAALGAPR